jgi:hypothetical protein
MLMSPRANITGCRGPMKMKPRVDSSGSFQLPRRRNCDISAYDLVRVALVN